MFSKRWQMFTWRSSLAQRTAVLLYVMCRNLGALGEGDCSVIAFFSVYCAVRIPDICALDY